MIRQLRLKGRERRARLIVVFLLFLLVGGLGGYQLERRYGFVSHLAGVLDFIKQVVPSDTDVRGTIYDKNLIPIAVNIERVSVYARIREIESIPKMVSALDSILAIDEGILRDQLASGALRFWIAKDISQKQENSLRDLNLPGVYFQSEAKRFYPYASTASHILGYVEDGIGFSGVEMYYNRLLTSKGIPQDLVLSLNLKIQNVLQQLVKNIGNDEKILKVAAYLMDGQTGEIVGGAQIPQFNPNIFIRYPPDTLRNQFLDLVYLPEKFRLLLRDAASLVDQVGKEVSNMPWCLRPNVNSLSGQLRLLDYLAIDEPIQIDRNLLLHRGKREVKTLPIAQTKSSLGLIPERVTPLNLLTAYVSLLSYEGKVHPSIIGKVIEMETRKEILSFKKHENKGQGDNKKNWVMPEFRKLFRSQSQERGEKAYFFRDSILLSFVQNKRQRFSINDLAYITFPAGTNDLHMLVVVQRTPAGVMRKSSKDKSLEQLIAAKIERISVLHQVSKTVADVLEPGLIADGNYQGKRRPRPEQNIHENLDQTTAVYGIMPDLKGLSLRKGLRLLQGMQLKIDIYGTGKIIDQEPRPGTSLRGINDCLLTLEKNDDINLEKLSNGL